MTIAVERNIEIDVKELLKQGSSFCLGVCTLYLMTALYDAVENQDFSNLHDRAVRIACFIGVGAAGYLQYYNDLHD